MMFWSLAAILELGPYANIHFSVAATSQEDGNVAWHLWVHCWYVQQELTGSIGLLAGCEVYR